MTRDDLIKNWPNCGRECNGIYDCGCQECQGEIMFGAEIFRLGQKKVLSYLKNKTFNDNGCRLPVELRPTGCLEYTCGRYN